MKIILYKDVPSLGEMGDIKVVSDGYARNYLLPKKIAVRYTKATKTELEQKQQSIDRHKKEKADAAADFKSRIESKLMDIAVAAGKNGRLFGSITSSAVVDFLSTEGIEIERKRIELPAGGIKTIGEHVARVKLYGKNDALLKINVRATGENDKAPSLLASQPIENEDAVASQEETQEKES